MLTHCLLLALFGPANPPVQSHSVVESTAVEGTQAATGYIHNYEWVEKGEFDPASEAVLNGIVWYGTWEAAMAEKERTGKPVMLHLGSPRCPKTCVPGIW